MDVVENQVSGQTLTKFLPSAAAIVEEVRAACEARDLEQVRLHAHKLKSSARMVGADNLADACLALEMVGQEGDWQDITGLCLQLVEAMKQVDTAIKCL